MTSFTELATIETPGNSTLAEGENLTLSCQVSGDQFPSVSWVQVVSGKRFTGGYLSLQNISRNAAGEYRCEASNLCSIDSRVTVVDVQCEFYIDPVSWSIILTISYCSVLMVTRKKSICRNICPEPNVMHTTRQQGY